MQTLQVTLAFFDCICVQSTRGFRSSSWFHGFSFYFCGTDDYFILFLYLVDWVQVLVNRVGVSILFS